MKKLGQTSYYSTLLPFCQVLTATLAFLLGITFTTTPSATAKTVVTETTPTATIAEAPDPSSIAPANPDNSDNPPAPTDSANADPADPNAPAKTLSDAQKTAITANCATTKDDLKKLQQSDSHARIYLGGRYEKINSKFIAPFNSRLAENNLSTPELVTNQNQLTAAKSTFTTDFIDYQRELEALVSQDCTSEPEKFYAQLVKVRAKRQVVATDVSTIRSLAQTHLDLATALKEKL